MGLSDRDYQKQNYDRATGNKLKMDDPAYRHERKADLSSTKFNASTGELELSISDEEEMRQREKRYRKPPGYYQALNSKKPSNVHSWIYFLFVIFGLSFLVAIFDDVRASSASPVPDVSSSAPAVSSPVLPSTSLITSSFSSSEAFSPFSIVAPAGGNHYYFKLKNSSTNAVVLIGFVRSGSTFSGKVPSGSYYLETAGGTEWLGESELFGKFTEIQRTDRPLEFHDYSGQVVTMTKRIDGNLKTTDIYKKQF